MVEKLDKKKKFIELLKSQGFEEKTEVYDKIEHLGDFETNVSTGSTIYYIRGSGEMLYDLTIDEILDKINEGCPE